MARLWDCFSSGSFFWFLSPPHPRSVNTVRHPRGSYISITRCCLWSGHTRKQSNSLALFSVSEKVVPNSVLRGVLGRMKLTLHATRRTPHGASRLVQAMPAWLVKTRHAPSRHGRDARVYSHTYDYGHAQTEYPPPLPPDTTLRKDDGWCASADEKNNEIIRDFYLEAKHRWTEPLVGRSVEDGQIPCRHLLDAEKPTIRSTLGVARRCQRPSAPQPRRTTVQDMHHHKDPGNVGFTGPRHIFPMGHGTV